MEPALIVTTPEGNTILDQVTRNIFPPAAVRFFNTTLVKAGPVNVNNWSLLHLGYGWLMGRLGFSFQTMALTHGAFEALEVALAAVRVLRTDEATDIALDSVFAWVGFALA